MNVEQIAERADLALADLATNGGLMNPEQSARFIRIIMDQPTILRECRTYRMGSFQTKINKVDLGSMMLRPARQAPAVVGSETRGRALVESERTKVTTSFIELNAKEIIAEIRIPYEALEDNIEQAAFQNTILEMMGRRAAVDLEMMLIRSKIGATGLAAGQELLGLTNGLLARANAHVVDHDFGAIDDSLFNNLIKAMPKKYRQNKGLLRFYVPQDVEQDYRHARAQRGTGLGDSTLVGDTPLPVYGVPMKGVACLPEANIVLTRPDNIIFGIWRDITMQSEQLISEREIKIVMTLRADTQVEEADAIVKGIDISNG